MSSIFVFFKVKLLKGNIYLFYYFILFINFFLFGGEGVCLSFKYFGVMPNMLDLVREQ